MAFLSTCEPRLEPDFFDVKSALLLDPLLYLYQSSFSRILAAL